MFTTIFKYELKYWLRQPAVYVYALVIFLFSATIMGGMAEEGPNSRGGALINSASGLLNIANYVNIFVFFLLPTIIGFSIYRDYSSRMYQVLYAYPFRKSAYLFAKFLSAFTVTAAVILTIGLGFEFGLAMPWTNPDSIAPFRLAAYLQLYLFFLLPGILFFGAVVFAVVTFTRNIYAGFITVIFIVLLRGLTNSLAVGLDSQVLAALLDPLGRNAVKYYTQYWSVAESNTQLLPIRSLVWYNRLLWLAVSAALFAWVYRRFTFSQNPVSLAFKKQAASTATSNVPGRLVKVDLPNIQLQTDWWSQLKATWKLARFDFRYIVSSWSFASILIGGTVFIIFILSMANRRWETETYPVTWQMLELPSFMFSAIIDVVIFLYAGLLIQRAKLANMHQLVDTTPIPNWSLLLSKVLALLKVEIVLLALLMVGGIITQITKGYYHFEVGHYLFELYGIYLIHFVIWTLLAVFVHTLFDQPYLSFFLLLFVPFGFGALADLGPKLGLPFLEQAVFRYNQAPGSLLSWLPYSDLDGYGTSLSPYFIYKFYWSLAGLIFLALALLLWKRGLPDHFKARLRIARSRLGGRLAIGMALLATAFLSVGYYIYHESNIKRPYFSEQQEKSLLSDAIIRYRPYENFAQPKISSVQINMDMYPASRTFQSTGKYTLINRTTLPIDTLIINYKAQLQTDYQLDRVFTPLIQDTIANYAHFDMLHLTDQLMPGDSLQLTFSLQSEPLTLLHKHDFVRGNGTYIRDEFFPRIGNWLTILRDLDTRQNQGRTQPTDSSALFHSFISKDSDRINFEATVSTAADQIALAPGYLQRSWQAEGRNYYHYRMDKKIGHAFLFTSGRYAIAKNQWRGIDLEVYYHPAHAYNIDRMLRGMQAALRYCSEAFGPYQFRQVRMIEFAQSGLATAHAYPNTIPSGEGAGFIARVDDSVTGGVDFAFGTAVHEVAHQWWGYQVMPADVLGAKMIVESLPEYVNLRVKERERSMREVRQYLRHNLDMYLRGRAGARKPEQPLQLVASDQGYIYYAKGALAFYALSNHLGETNFNAILRDFVSRTAYQDAPFTTSLELVDLIRQATPDSLQYLIRDLFETVTLYDNRLTDVRSTLLPDGQYQVDLTCLISKYRSVDLGKRVYEEPGQSALMHVSDAEGANVQSLALADYIEIGFFDAAKREIALKKFKIEQIKNEISVVLPQPPTEVVIDPYYQLIDGDVRDNRKQI